MIYLWFYSSQEQAGSSSVEVVEVDIAVGPPSTQDDEIEKKSAIRDLGRIWQDRIVPYVISSAFNSMYTFAYNRPFS